MLNIKSFNQFLKEEATLKNKWYPIPTTELIKIKREVFKLINTAYSDIGGHLNFKEIDDVLKNDTNFLVIDLDYDSDPDALIAYKDKKLGNKHIAIGHDGTKDAKKAVINQQATMLKSKGNYVEVSGKLVDIMNSYNVKKIDDENTVRTLLKGKDIIWHGDGSYTRNIGGHQVTKYLYGTIQ